MATRPQPDALPLDASQLVLGLYIWLDMKWLDHPFLSNRFLLKKPEDLATLQALPTKGCLYYLPDKSTAEPLPLVTEPAEPDPAELQRQAEAAEAIRQAKARLAKVRQVKEAAARANKAWTDAASSTREALSTLARSPRAAGQLLDQLSRETAAAISQGPDVLLHLLEPKEEQSGPQFHALNVMTLCMLVGKKANLNQRDLTDLAMAALAHDAGKADIPISILKNGHRKRFEEDHYRMHVKHSVQLAEESGVFTRRAIEMIAQHHEAVDGSGWPKGLSSEVGICSRILALCNRYDRLCFPEATNIAPLMPSEALAHMLRQEGHKHDPQLLTALIQLLGVYPPGTVVNLSDGSLALVVSPGAHLQRPRVLIYSPDMTEAEAPMLDLGKETELRVVRTTKPADLKPEVLAWLNPQKRLACYFSAESP